MTLHIEISPEEESRLIAAARRQGMTPTELAKKLMSDHLPPPLSSPEPQDPTLALFEEWEREDSQMSPAEIEEARREFEEFKENINAERRRAGARIIYP